MKDKENIIKTLIQIKPELVNRYNVKEIGLFGSYIRDEQKEESDIDILVDFEKTISLFKFADMKNYLDDVLGHNVDLVMKDCFKPMIGKQILQEVIYL